MSLVAMGVPLEERYQMDHAASVYLDPGAGHMTHISKPGSKFEVWGGGGSADLMMVACRTGE
jgi:hypothetical protein